MGSGTCRPSWGGNTIEDDWTDWEVSFGRGFCKKVVWWKILWGLGVFCGKIILGRKGLDWEDWSKLAF